MIGGGSYEASIQFTRLRAEKDKTPYCGYISRSLSQQDASVGFHICIVGYVFKIPVSLFWKPHLMIRLFLSSTQDSTNNPKLIHIKPVNAAASKARPF